MKGVALLLSMLVSARAGAEVVDTPMAPPPDPDRGVFWRDMLYPHKDEVDAIIVKATQAIANAEIGWSADYDPSGVERLRFYRETLGPLRYARTLAPENTDVLRMLGLVADEIGDTRLAIDALKAAVDELGPERAGAAITGRLGIIYLRLGRTDEAIRYLRAAQGPIVPLQPITAHVLVHLANALAARGQMGDAIDTLATYVQPAAQYYPNELALVTFALAVLYDRDEQRGAAFEILDKMQSTLQGQLGTLGAFAMASMRFVPAADRHYYFGLLHEASGNLAEARTEFALYAASGDLPFRRRALEHVASIDALRRATSASSTSHRGPTPRPATPGVPRRYRGVP